MSNDILDLSSFLANEGEPVDFSIDDDSFRLVTEDEALWAMRRHAVAQRRIAEVERLAAIERERIDAWVKANTEKHVNEASFFEGLLCDYAVRVREDENDGRKSLDFPDGSITSRITPSKVAVTDLDLFLSWAEHNGHDEWVRVKREADVSAIKKVADFDGNTVIDPTTGRVIDGLQHTVGGISVTVKVAD